MSFSYQFLQYIERILNMKDGYRPTSYYFYEAVGTFTRLYRIADHISGQKLKDSIRMSFNELCIGM
ncbi:hypothetical protein [Paenibacillus odorifer]|uniref:hypothetical protein n=1 Tax=Paenibacillus odorifer TaxID=189426 RepID=UPI0014823E06|nr:hypothetical protein [Paenibacillus odorifer]